jgi:hypothetical protein
MTSSLQGRTLSQDSCLTGRPADGTMTRLGPEYRGSSRSPEMAMSSSLLLGCLSPYLSADDSIDGLLLPDVEGFCSHLYTYCSLYIRFFLKGKNILT